LENKTYFPKRIICWQIVSALTTGVVFLHIFFIFFLHYILRTWKHIKVYYCT